MYSEECPGRVHRTPLTQRGDLTSTSVCCEQTPKQPARATSPQTIAQPLFDECLTLLMLLFSGMAVQYNTS